MKKNHGIPLEDQDFNVWRLHFIDNIILSINSQPAVKFKIK